MSRGGSDVPVNLAIEVLFTKNADIDGLSGAFFFEANGEIKEVECLFPHFYCDLHKRMATVNQ